MLGLILVTLFAVAFGCPMPKPEALNLPQDEGQVTGSDKVLKEGCEVRIQGEVTGREERREGLQDGEFALKVSTADYGMLNVVYSSFRLCHNEVGASVKEGDRIEVYGKVITKNRITVCLSKDHYIKKL